MMFPDLAEFLELSLQFMAITLPVMLMFSAGEIMQYFQKYKKAEA